MKIRRLQKRLEKCEDKLSIFANKKLLNKYNLSEEELCNIIEEYLTDEQKAKLFEYEHFRNLFPYRIKSIMKLIKDDNLKLELLKDDELISDMNEFDIVDIIKSLTDDGKMKILKNNNFKKKLNIDKYDVTKIIISFMDENKIKLLSNKDFIENKLKLGKDRISIIVASIENEEKKLKFIDEYEFQSKEIENIVRTCSDKYKKAVLIENKYNFRKYEIESLIASMDINEIINFLNKNKQFFIQNDIGIHSIIEIMDSEKELEFISKLEDIEELSIRREKKNICKIK